MAGAKIAFLNPARFEYNFPVAAYLDATPAKLVQRTCGDPDRRACEGAGGARAPSPQISCARAKVAGPAPRASPRRCKTGERRAFGSGRSRCVIRPYSRSACARERTGAQVTGATCGVLAEGSNAAGAYLAGAVPHRIVGGRAIATPGLSAWQMLKLPLVGLCALWG